MRLPLLMAGLTAAFMLSIFGSQSTARSPKISLADKTFAMGNISVITKEHKEKVAEATLASISLEVPEEVTDTIEPAPEPIMVTVAKGDSLSKIAKAHNTTVNRLFDANTSIANPDVINPGDQIRVPFPDEVLTARQFPATLKPAATSKKAPSSQPKRISSNAPAVASSSIWDQLAQCESGGNWAINTGNGYYGGLQFTLSAWRAVGGQAYPHENSREEQIHRAEILLARSSWSQWPACTLKLGLR